MVQLDLFGGMFEEPAKPAAKKPEAKKAVVSATPEVEESTTANLPSDIVFNDGKIGVKIKVKEKPAEVVVSPVVVEEKTDPIPSPVEAPRAATVNMPATPVIATTAKVKKAKQPPQKRGRKSFKEIDAELGLVQVPDDEILFQKQYYSISIVAKWFRLNTSLLRAWDNEFDILKPRKNRKGDRLFRPEDVKNIQLIYQLLRHKKYTVEGAKEYIKAHKKQADVQLHLGQTLQKFKSFLLEMKATLEA
jgi:DNA-binding transcriptional MerR regulator